MKGDQQKHIDLINFIKRQARQQAAKDIAYCPIFVGARNTFEERVYLIEYNKAFAKELQNEQ